MVEYCPYCTSAQHEDTNSEKFKNDRALMQIRAQAHKFRPEIFGLTKEQIMRQ